MSTTLPGHGWRRARELDMPTQMLALAAQLVLCAAPLLVAASAVARRFNGRSVSGALTRYLGLEGKAAQDVASLFSSSNRVSTTELVSGLIIGVVFGTGVSATQQRGYEMIWSLPRAGWRNVWRQLTWVVGLLVYLFVILHAGRVAHNGDGRLHSGVLIRTVSQFVVTLLFYWWSQHLLLSGRVSWRRLLPGAACMSFAMTVLVLVSAIVLPGQITEQVTDYGPVGATFVLSIWLVVLAGVIFGGSLVGAVLVERHDKAAGMVTETITETVTQTITETVGVAVSVPDAGPGSPPGPRPE